MSEISRIPDEAAAHRLIAAAVDAAAADEVRVLLSASVEARVSHGGGGAPGPLPVLEGRRLSVAVTCAFGNRHATVTTHDASTEGIERALARAEAMAKVATADLDWAAEGSSVAPPTIARAWDQASARMEIGAALQLSAELLAEARRRELSAAGELVQEAKLLCLGTRRGFFGYHRQTCASFTTTLRSDGGAAMTVGAAAVRRADLDPRSLLLRATELASRGVPGRLDAGMYPLVLGSEAVAALVLSLLPQLDQRAADEGRSLFSRRGVGQRLFGDVSLRVDPADPVVPGAPFDGRGQLRRAESWIEKGVLRKLYAAPGWALRARHKPSALPDSVILSHSGPAVPSEEALIQELGRGVFVPRLGALQVLDPLTLRVSAYGEGAAFLVEEGKLTKPIGLLGFEQPLPELFAAAERATAPARVQTSALLLACPALRLRAVRCTGDA